MWENGRNGYKTLTQGQGDPYLGGCLQPSSDGGQEPKEARAKCPSGAKLPPSLSLVIERAE